MKRNEIIKVAQWFSDSNLSRLVWKNETSSLELEKEPVFISDKSREKKRPFPEGFYEDEETEELEEETYILRSPVVGTFYTSPSPDDRPFVKEGQKVSRGDVLCIVEAMKLMNEISSPVDGIIKRIFPENDEMVEFDGPLMEIEVE